MNKDPVLIFLYVFLFFVCFVALSKLDEWARNEDAKHQPVFQQNPYVTHS